MTDSRLAGTVPEPPPEVLPRSRSPAARTAGATARRSRATAPTGRCPSRSRRRFRDPPRQDSLHRAANGPRPGTPRAATAPTPMAGGFPKSILRTASPNLYWVFIRMPVLDRTSRPPMPTTLVLATPSLRGGGLLFDFTPWLIGGGVVFALSVLHVAAARPGDHARPAADDRRRGSHRAGPLRHAGARAARADELGRLGTALNHMSARLREFFTGQKAFPRRHRPRALLAARPHGNGPRHSRPARRRKAARLCRRRARGTAPDVGTRSRATLLFQSRRRRKKRGTEARGARRAGGRVVAREAKDRGGVVVDVPGGLTALAEPDLLARALGNVIRNALRYAAPVARRRRVLFLPSHVARARAAPPARSPFPRAPNGDRIILSVTDCGPGVPEEALHRLFDPFFRPESARTRESTLVFSLR